MTASLCALAIIAGCGGSDRQAARSPAREAAAYRHGLRPGDAMGEVVAPRVGIRARVAADFSQAVLARGLVGWYTDGHLPGEGHLVYLAGHRTTHGAPLRALGRLRRGDLVQLRLPYATADYAVIRSGLVGEHDFSILNPGRAEVLRVPASTIPASHRRLIVTAHLRSLRLRAR